MVFFRGLQTKRPFLEEDVDRLADQLSLKNERLLTTRHDVRLSYSKLFCSTRGQLGASFVQSWGLEQWRHGFDLNELTHINSNNGLVNNINNIHQMTSNDHNFPLPSTVGVPIRPPCSHKLKVTNLGSPNFHASVLPARHEILLSVKIYVVAECGWNSHFHHALNFLSLFCFPFFSAYHSPAPAQELGNRWIYWKVMFNSLGLSIQKGSKRSDSPTWLAKCLLKVRVG